MPTIHGSQLSSAIEVEVEESPNSVVVVMPGLLPAVALLGSFGIIGLLLLRLARRREPSPRQILDRRLASGELSQAQYEKLRAVLGEPG